jgi:excisionase family DNA binding protein
MKGKNTNSGTPKLAYSLEEAADLIGVSKGHLRNESERGKLQLVKSGRRTLVLHAEICRYIDDLISKMVANPRK